MTSRAALLLTRGLIEQAGPTRDEPVLATHLDEVAELVTRLVSSMIERPLLAAVPRGAQRQTLGRWIAGAVDAILAGTPAAGDGPQ